MRLSRKKAASLFVSLLLTAGLVCTLGLNALADEVPQGQSESQSTVEAGGDESAASSPLEEISSQGQSSASDQSSQAASETPDGMSAAAGLGGLGFSPFVAQLNPGNIVSTETGTFVSTGGHSIDSTSGIVVLGDSTFSSNDTQVNLEYNPFDPATYASGLTFELPGVYFDNNTMYYLGFYGYSEFDSSKYSGLDLYFEALYPGCYLDFVAYYETNVAPIVGGELITYGDVTGFMQSTATDGFWTKYDAFDGGGAYTDSVIGTIADSISVNKALSMSGGGQTQVDHRAARATLYPGEKVYFADVTVPWISDAGIDGYEWDAESPYTMLGFSNVEKIVVYGAGHGTTGMASLTEYPQSSINNIERYRVSAICSGSGVTFPLLTGIIVDTLLQNVSIEGFHLGSSYVAAGQLAAGSQRRLLPNTGLTTTLDFSVQGTHGTNPLPIISASKAGASLVEFKDYGGKIYAEKIYDRQQIYLKRGGYFPSSGELTSPELLNQVGVNGSDTSNRGINFGVDPAIFSAVTYAGDTQTLTIPLNVHFAATGSGAIGYDNASNPTKGTFPLVANCSGIHLIDAGETNTAETRIDFNTAPGAKITFDSGTNLGSTTYAFIYQADSIGTGRTLPTGANLYGNDSTKYGTIVMNGAMATDSPFATFVNKSLGARWFYTNHDNFQYIEAGRTDTVQLEGSYATPFSPNVGDEVYLGEPETLDGNPNIVYAWVIPPASAMVARIDHLIVGGNSSASTATTWTMTMAYALKVTMNNMPDPAVEIVLPVQTTTFDLTANSSQAGLTDVAVNGAPGLVNVMVDSTKYPDLETLDLSGHLTPSRKLTAAPAITGWTPTHGNDTLLDLKNNNITVVAPGTNPAVAGSYGIADKIDVRNQTPGLQTLDLSLVSNTNLDTLLYQAGNEATLEVLNLKDMINLDAGVFKANNESGTRLSALTEVTIDGCNQLAAGKDIDFANNDIVKFSMKNITGSGKIKDIDLSGNEMTYIDASLSIASGATSLSAQGTEMTGTMNLGQNYLTGVRFEDSIANGMLNMETLDLKGQQGTPGGYYSNFFDMDKGVYLKGNAKLAQVIFKDNSVNGFDVQDCTALEYVEGSAYHSVDPQPVPPTATELILRGKLWMANNHNLASTAPKGGINFVGHGIEEAYIKNLPFTDIDLSYQNKKGDFGFIATPSYDPSSPDRGVLKIVDVRQANAGLSSLWVSDNAITTVNTGTPTTAPAKGLELTGAIFANRATIDADRNLIKDVDVDAAKIQGGQTMEQLWLNDNQLINLHVINATGLKELRVNRHLMANNTFENGSVILTNCENLGDFAPVSFDSAEQPEADSWNRAMPVVPNESPWAPYEYTRAELTSPDPEPDYIASTSETLGTDYGFFYTLPIIDMDIAGCKTMTHLRIPGNRLTGGFSSTGAELAPNLEYIDISGAPYVDASGKATIAYDKGRSAIAPAAMSRGIGTGFAGTALDTASGKITGEFVGHWPNLKTLYIYNNQITRLDIGQSVNVEHILAYQNNLGQGYSSGAVEVSQATNLRLLDVERNPNIKELVVPTQNLVILRAGLAGLTAYPNVENITTLEELYVDHNNLGGVAPPIYPGNPNIKVLNISANRFSAFPSLDNSPTLEEFYAYDNQATSVSNFAPNGKLAIVDLANNKLMGIPTLPDSIVYFDISQNRFGHVLQIPNIPKGMSQTTAYDKTAHEVYSRYSADPTQFYGTLAIEDNQITALPTVLVEAFQQGLSDTAGRVVYQMYVDRNVLDIDVYGLENGQKVEDYKGRQKWLAVTPSIKPTLLNTYNDEKLGRLLRASTSLYRPWAGELTDPNAYEAPLPIHKYAYGWDPSSNEYFYNGEISKSGVAIAHVRILENWGRNGIAYVAITVYDKRRNSIAGTDEYGMTVDGEKESGIVLDGVQGKDPNYNPNTGATVED